MKVVVLKTFFDLQFQKQRAKNEVLELSKPRCLELIALGLAEEIVEEKPKKKPKK